MMTNKKTTKNVSSTEIQKRGGSGKNVSKIETLYTTIMCFVANCLSSVALEVGSKSSLGNSVTKSTTFNAFFRRSYNLKIKVMLTDIISGLIATVMLTLGDKYKYPYLYIPWLLNTIQGMALLEGPALLNTAYKIIPNAEAAAGSFLIITIILFIEEIFLWNDVFWSFKNCWDHYDNRKRIMNTSSKEKSNIENRRLPTAVNKKDMEFTFERIDTSNSPSEGEVELLKIMRTNTNSSNDSIVSKPPSSQTDIIKIQNKCADVTG